MNNPIEVMKKSEYNGMYQTYYYIDDNGHRVIHREDGHAVIHLYSGNKDIVRKEQYFQHGKLHRLDGPAEIERFMDGSIRRETYYVDGVETNLNGASSKSYFKDGKLSLIGYSDDYLVKYYPNKKRPNKVSFTIHGKIEWKMYNYKHDVSFDETKPNFVYYFPSGSIRKKTFYHDRYLESEYVYYLNDSIKYMKRQLSERKYHIKYFSVYGVLTKEVFWYGEEKLHRLDGPAEINYKDGEIISKKYYRNGEEVDAEYAEWCLEHDISITDKFTQIAKKHKMEWKLKFG